MAEKVNKGDFVELDYVGLLKEPNVVFDTNIEAVAKKEGVFDPKMTYGPVYICVGQGQILQGLDASLEGLEIGKETELLLPPERAFGRKDGKLMKLVPTSAFKKQNINPVVGLQINIDGMVGTIRTVTGGRTVVDFNHPFAGKEVIYRVTIRRKLAEDKEKVMALVELALNQKRDAIGISIREGKATISVRKEFSDELLNMLKERITKTMPSIKAVEFITERPEAKTEAKKKAQLVKGSKPAGPAENPGHKPA
ncbi:peptidylprolyl isomerase [Candidatus Woesearchaeota archaeon]|nr:peptidylprolyl isomerase [Candidatus Woesearchaeota archaeon]